MREVAQKNYLLWMENPRHPSLRFKCLEGNVWSVRVGQGYRALAEVEGTQVTWIWIGPHVVRTSMTAEFADGWTKRPAFFAQSMTVTDRRCIKRITPACAANQAAPWSAVLSLRMT